MRCTEVPDAPLLTEQGSQEILQLHCKLCILRLSYVAERVTLRRDLTSYPKTLKIKLVPAVTQCVDDRASIHSKVRQSKCKYCVNNLTGRMLS